MSNATLDDTTTVVPEGRITSGSTYTSDPVLDRAPETKYGRNEFLKFRDARPIVTSGLAIVATGAFVLAAAFLIGNVAFIAATMLSLGSVAIAASAVVIGSRRSHRAWSYQLASYIGVASAVLAALVIFNVYFSAAIGTGVNL